MKSSSIGRAPLALVASLAILLVPHAAFAQTVPTMPAAAVLTPYVVVASVLSVVVGFIAQGVNTGSIFGIVTVPQAWLPWLSLGGSFAGAFAASLTQAGSLTTVAIFNAIMAGFVGLMGAGAGSAVHMHLGAAKRTVSAASPPSTPASSSGGSPDASSRSEASTPVASKREALAAPRTRNRLIPSILLAALSLPAVGFASTLALMTGTTGCTQAAWQSFVTSAGMFISTVQTFVQGVEAVWAIVSPLIPASAAPAVVATYNDALLAVNNAIAALQAAVSAGNAVQQAPANYAELEAAVQAAVLALYNSVTQWQPIGVNAGVSPSPDLSSLKAQTQAILDWK